MSKADWEGFEKAALARMAEGVFSRRDITKIAEDFYYRPGVLARCASRSLLQRLRKAGAISFKLGTGWRETSPARKDPTQ